VRNLILTCLLLMTLSVKPSPAQQLCANTRGELPDSSGMGRKVLGVTTMPADGLPVGKAVPGATIVVSAPGEDPTSYTTGSNGCVSFPAQVGHEYRITVTAKGYGESDHTWRAPQFGLAIGEVISVQLPRAGPPTSDTNSDQPANNNSPGSQELPAPSGPPASTKRVQPGPDPCANIPPPPGPTSDDVIARWRADTFDSPPTPVPGVNVTVTAPGQCKTYTTGPDGTFTFSAKNGETYHLAAFSPQYGRSQTDWTPFPEPPGLPSNTEPFLLQFPGKGKSYDPQGGIVRDTGARKDLPWYLDLLFSILPLAAYFGLQEITVRAMHASMMKHGGAGAARQDIPPVAELAGDAATAGSSPGPEVEFFEMSSDTPVQLSGAAAQRLKRIRFTERRKFWVLQFSILMQLCGAGAGAAIASLVHKHDNWISFLTQPPVIFLGVLGAFDLLAGMWILSLYAAGKRVLELIAVLLSVAIASIAIASLFFEIPLYEALPAMALQILVLWRGWRRIRGAATEDGNRKLVILRVFGSDKNAAATFGELMSGWRFAGSFLTIADPSYIRYQFSVFTRGNRTKSLAVMVAIGILSWPIQHLPGILSDLQDNSSIGLFFQRPAVDWVINLPAASRNGLVYAVLSLLAIWPMVLYTRKRFLKTPEAAIDRVEQMEHATLTVESDYQGSAYFCFDDVWKPAVHKMLEVADIVMMDLRGFSAARQGCAYEIGLLVDGYPIERLLFLIDKTTPKDLLFDLVRIRWGRMRGDSPNRKISSARINIFETGKRTGRDNRNIQAALSALVDGRLELTGRKLTNLTPSNVGDILSETQIADSPKPTMQQA
jgi:hypothetical protein